MKERVQTTEQERSPSAPAATSLWQRQTVNIDASIYQQESGGGLTDEVSAEPGLGHDFSRIQVSANSTPAIQTKLPVSSPGDVCEQEADRIAEQVTRSPKPVVVEKIAGKEGDTVQAAPGILSHLQGGRPLPSATRAFFEPRFGHDFSRVRVHTDAQATAAAQALNAQAFTVGHNIAFGAEHYKPETSGGRWLLAHELAHVTQQTGRKKKTTDNRIYLKEAGKKEEPKSTDPPVEVDIGFLRKVMHWDGSSRLYIPMGLAGMYAQKGQVWIDIHGQRRLILFIQAGSGVIFLKGNKGYLQTLSGFKDDVGLRSLAEMVSRKTRVLETFLEMELEFIKGIISATSLPGFFLVAGADLTQFIIENRKKFPRWIRGLKIFLLARRLLIKHAPTLYNILFTFAIKEVSAHLPDAITEKDAAKFVGVIVGSFSKKMLSSSLTMASAIVAVLLSALSPLAKAIPKALPEIGKEYQENPMALVNAFAKIKIQITPQVARKIINEYKANPITVHEALNELINGLSLLSE